MEGRYEEVVILLLEVLDESKGRRREGEEEDVGLKGLRKDLMVVEVGGWMNLARPRYLMV